MTKRFCETKIKDAKCIFDKKGTSGTPEDEKPKFDESPKGIITLSYPTDFYCLRRSSNS